MQNPIKRGLSWACYTLTHRFATIFAFFLLLFCGNTHAQSDIRLAKTILGVDLPDSGRPGNFNVIFELTVQNTGTTVLQNLQITDQLEQVNQYGTIFQEIVNPPIIMESDAAILPNTNVNYTGRFGQTNFFTSSGQLNPGQFIRLQFIAEVDPDAEDADFTPEPSNQAIASGFDGIDTVSDFSDSGRVPNSTNTGAVGDSGGSNDATPLTDCYERISTFTCNNEVNLSLNGDCIAVINPGNLIEGEAEDCDDGNYPLGGYYQVTIKTLDGLTIDDLDLSTVNTIEFDAQPFNAVMANVTNVVLGNSCWVRVNLQDKQAPICRPEGDLEALIDLDGIDQNDDGNLLDDLDPSGRDDLQDEYILCNFVEQNGVDIYFDALEADDFLDCSAVESRDSTTLFTEICDDADLFGFGVDNSRFNNARFVISGVYERTWSARDVNGLNNDNGCSQRVFVLRPRASEVRIDALAETDCAADLTQFYADSAPYFTVAAGNADVFNGGAGSGSGASAAAAARRYAFNEGFSCGYIVQLTEGTTADLCGGSTKQFRAYSVIERCTQNQIYRNFQQILKIEDRTAPEFEDIPDFIVGTDKFTCTAEGNILTASITDDCSTAQVDRVTIERLFPQSSNSADNFVGTIENGGSVNDLPMGIGTYRLTYYASDDCENTRAEVATLRVEDNTPPVVICDDELNLSLINDGFGSQFARLQTDGLDETSYDNCYPIIFRIRSTNNANLSDNEFGLFAEFSCEDLGNPDLMAEMLVIEDRDGDGAYPDDDGGLISSCMARINLEDKAAPDLVCEDIDIDCNDAELQALLDPTRVDFRAPTFTGGCPGNSNTTLSLEIIDANYSGGCEAGSFIRRFTATRQLNGFTRTSVCDQLVTVSFMSDWNMVFPPDYVINCGSGETVPPALDIDEILTNNGCDTWGVEVDEELFDVVTGGGCQKIIRTYKFINWCTWSPNEAPEKARVNRPVDLILNATDVVRLQHRSKSFGINELSDQTDGDIYDEEQDFEGRKDSDGALVILNRNHGNTRYNTFGFVDEEEINDRENILRVDANNYGSFTYTQIIKIVDDVAPVITAINDFTLRDTDGNCVETIRLPIPTVQDCQSDYTITYDAGVLGSGTFSGVAPNFNEVTLDNTIIGATSYPIAYTVTDGCGNVSRTTFNVTIVDATPPTAYCVPGLSIDLDVNGEAEIWASDFNFNSFDGCSESVLVTFADPRLFPDSTTFVATCDDLGTQDIELWVTDPAGNSSICRSLLDVQSDRAEVECPAGGLIRIVGNIATENGDQVEGVAVHLAGAMEEMHYTDVSGMYEFADIPDGAAIRLQPERNDDPLNGVTTHDLVLIRKHILGLEVLDSPYKMIAADANRSGSVTTYDLVELRKLILGVNTDLADNQSWCFIDKSYAFPDATNPWAEAFPERLELENISNSELNANFVAIKTGDVNNSAIPNALTDINERTVTTLPINVMAKRNGDMHVLTFTTNFLEQLEGLQLELDFDAQTIDFEEVKYGILEAHHINTMHVTNGKLTFSWNYEREIMDMEAPLFELVFRANRKIDWTKALRVDESRITAEAYMYDDNGDLNIYSIQLRNALAAEEGVVLYQNAPNPFTERTVIPFDLTTAQTATLNIYSTTGQLVHTQSGDFVAGRNEIEVKWKDKITTGLLYYTLETATGRATRKMFVVE